MKICEICGNKEDVENINVEQMESVMLHICENCLEDRKWFHDEDGSF